MTRIGMNPARNRVSDYSPARVTIAMLVYLPHAQGYFRHRFDVIKLSMASLLSQTTGQHDLLVFDNGSSEEVKTWLQGLVEAGNIHFLLTASENIGKLGALRLMAGFAPGELIAYCDDDTFFYPGWLDAHLEIFDHFPNVGMVSGSPERTLFDHGIKSNLAISKSRSDIQISFGRRIPEQWERDWAIALGKDLDTYLAQTAELDDIMLERKGLSAYATACHNQFLAPKAVLTEFLSGPWSGRLMGGMNDLDNAIDQAGYLRLTTPQRTIRLIGNVVSPEILAEAQSLGVGGSIQTWEGLRSRSTIWRRLLLWKPLRWLLQGLYNRLFWLLSGQSGSWAEDDGHD